MPLSIDRAKLQRLNNDVAALRGKEATAARKAADAQKKMASAQTGAARATSSASQRTYTTTAEREMRVWTDAQQDQAKFSTQIASKSREIAQLQERISREEQREHQKSVRDADMLSKQRARVEKDAIAANRALQQRVEDLEQQVLSQLEKDASATPNHNPIPPEGEAEAYDVFISHASEDKTEFVDDFARKARDAGLRVWYDRFALEWGDSLRSKIDAGLAGSYFGVVILSPKFFAKQWTSYELDGLLDKALDGKGRLLPIWHRVTRDDVQQYAPSLAGRLALNTSFMSTDDIVAELVKLRDRYKDPSV